MKYRQAIRETMGIEALRQAGTMRAGCASPLPIGTHLIQTPGRLGTGGRSTMNSASSIPGTVLYGTDKTSHAIHVYGQDAYVV